MNENQAPSDKIPIKDMAKAVLLSGRLTEMHVKNLQTYPFIIFNGLEEAETVYDINTNREAQNDVHSSVDYYISFKKGSKQPNKQESIKLIGYLTNAIATLLWHGIDVRVFNKKTGKQLGE